MQLISVRFSKHKIVFTDWSDPKSFKPDLEDPEYPLKSFIFLLSGKSWRKKVQRIVKFLKPLNIPFSGAVLNSGSQISFKDKEDRHFRFTSAISVAFAGKVIKSAVFSYSYGENLLCFKERLLSFKRNLDFSPDDFSVLGFRFGSDICFLDEECKHNLISDTFPFVKFVQIYASPGINFLQSILDSAKLHLIKIPSEQL